MVTTTTTFLSFNVSVGRAALPPRTHVKGHYKGQVWWRAWDQYTINNRRSYRNITVYLFSSLCTVTHIRKLNKYIFIVVQVEIEQQWCWQTRQRWRNGIFQWCCWSPECLCIGKQCKRWLWLDCLTRLLHEPMNVIAYVLFLQNLHEAKYYPMRKKKKKISKTIFFVAVYNLFSLVTKSVVAWQLMEELLSSITDCTRNTGHFLTSSQSQTILEPFLGGYSCNFNTLKTPYTSWKRIY